MENGCPTKIVVVNVENTALKEHLLNHKKSMFMQLNSEQLQQENARLAEIVRNLELQLFALYEEREASSGSDLSTTYQQNPHQQQVEK